MRILLPVCVLILASFSCYAQKYTCLPCGLSCDTIAFNTSGKCPHCSMILVSNQVVSPGEIVLEKGSGNFLIQDGRDSSRTIRIFYHKPKKFNRDSRVVLVIPGSGRDGNEYRDAWKTASEKHNILILSPSFPVEKYKFEDYHLGGIIKNTNLIEHVRPIETTNKVELAEDSIEFEVVHEPGSWIFSELDRIFELIKENLNLNTENYDIFGHSAGGHILHRMALFHSSDKVNRIVASNASFYTLPTTEFRFPFGIQDSPLTEVELGSVFRSSLILLLGEKDNAQETDGTFLISKSANQQGNHRFERGRFFFEKSKEVAGKSGVAFLWKLQIVPGVGHDFRKMSKAAAAYLYSPR